MNPTAAPLEHQAIAIAEGRILAIAPRAELLERYAVDEIQSRPTHALMPGFVDAWMCVQSRTSPAVAAAEALRAGITSFAAFGPRAHELASTASALHLHAVIGLAFTAEASSWAASELLWDEYAADPYVTFCFSPGDLRALDDAALLRLRRVADELDAPLSLALHADEAGIRESLEKFGVRPLERLDALGLLRPGVALRELTLLEDAEIDRLAGRGVSVIGCPQADLRRRKATIRFDLLLRRGILCAVGSGATHRKQTFDVLAEARLAGLLHGLDAGQILELATVSGARALGLAAQIGTLEPGRFADLIALDLATLATPYSTAENALAAIAYAATRHQVSDVWVGGRAMIHHGRLLAFDEEALLRELQEQKP